MREIGRWVLALIDSDSIRPFQAVMYAAFVLSGVDVLVVVTTTHPTSSPVRDAMGWTVHLVWCCGMVAAPIVTATGVGLTHIPPASYAGVLLQLCGDFAVMVLLAAYTLGIFEASWHSGAFGLVVYGALTACAGLLTFRSARRIWLVERLQGVM